MACVDVGDANPDISGNGIIISFAAQAGISILLASWSFLLSLADASSAVSNFARLLLQSEEGQARPAGDPTVLRMQRENARLQARLLVIHDLILLISDVQTNNGVALLIAALVQSKTLSLYHKHIVYDIVNFTGVSFCAALANIHQTTRDGRTSRSVAISCFAVLYLAFSIVFGNSLEKWDSSAPGKCYLTAGIALPDASHPYVDRIYLGITCFYLFSSLILCAWVALAGGPVPSGVRPGPAYNISGKPFMFTIGYFKWSIVAVALLQYPLHLYMVVTMRTANKGALGGDSEDSWGFGQIVALTMLGFTISKCFEGMWKYRKLGKVSNATAVGGNDGGREQGDYSPTNGSPEQDVALRDMSAK